MPDYTDGWCKMLKRSFPFLILALFLLPLVPLSSAQGGPGVNIDCESNPELNVHPLYNEPVELICTIENTSSADETIEISNEFEGGSSVQIQGASDEYSVAAGETEEFTVTFHKSGNSFSKEVWASMVTGMMANEKFIHESSRCVYENDDILIQHNFMSYPDDTREAVMLVAILKDGKIINLESGATPLD